VWKREPRAEKGNTRPPLVRDEKDELTEDAARKYKQNEGARARQSREDHVIVGSTPAFEIGPGSARGGSLGTT